MKQVSTMRWILVVDTNYFTGAATNARGAGSSVLAGLSACSAVGATEIAA